LSLSLDLGEGRSLQIGIRTSNRATRIRLVSGIEGVHAVVPKNFDTDELSHFAFSKRRWLIRTSRYYSRLREQCGGYEPGTIFYMGSKYRCNLVRDRRFSVIVSDSLGIITFHLPDMRSAARYQQDWYRQKTRAIIQDRLPQIAERMGIKYNKVTIKKQKSRWGSCSKNANLNFNLMLSAAPPEVIDYVMIHELAHVIMLDHSPRFWAIVEKTDPDYKTHRGWLRTFSALIKIG
jgi:predicted metal-dependent hydrolase